MYDRESIADIKQQMSVVMNKMSGGRVPKDVYEESLKVYRMIEGLELAQSAIETNE